MTKTEDTAICAGCCCGCLFILAGWASGIAFSVFGILALIHETNSEFRSDCKGCTIWSALLVQVILTLGGLYQTKDTNKRKSSHDDDVAAYWCAVVFHAVVWVAIGIWGLFEVYSQCVEDNFGGSEVRLMAKIWSIVVVSSGGLLFVAGALLCCVPESMRDGLLGRSTSQSKRKPRIKSETVDDENDVSGTVVGVVPGATNYAEAPV